MSDQRFGVFLINDETSHQGKTLPILSLAASLAGNGRSFKCGTVVRRHSGFKMHNDTRRQKESD